MSSRLAFQTQLASIMEVLANAAVAEICKLVDDDYAVVSLQMSQCQRENKALKRKLHVLELKMARGNAERRLRESALNSSRSRMQINTADRLRDSSPSTGGDFERRMDVSLWSGRAAAGDASNRLIHSDSIQRKSPDVELVELDADLVKEEKLSRVEEEAVSLIGDDGVVECIPRAPAGQRPGLELQEIQSTSSQSQTQGSRTRQTSSSRGVEKEEEEPAEVLVKLEEEELVMETRSQSSLSIQEGLVESSTDDDKAVLPFNEIKQTSTNHLSNLQECGPGFSESAVPQSMPVISQDPSSVVAVQLRVPDTNTPAIPKTSSNTSPLNSEYSLFELETFFTRWAPDNNSVSAHSGPSCPFTADDSDQDGAIVLETQPQPQPVLQPSQGSASSAGRISRGRSFSSVQIQPSVSQETSVSTPVRMQAPSSQPLWSKKSVILSAQAQLLQQRRDSNRLSQQHRSVASAHGTLSSSTAAVSNTHKGDKTGLSGSRTMSSTAAPPDRRSAATLACIEAAIAAQHQAGLLARHNKSQAASTLHSERRKKSYVCRVCGKAFSGLSNLEAHERVHTGEKPFRCDNCGKRFSEAGNLKKHQRVHTGEKPFSCDQCGKRFAWICNLRTHQQSATGCGAPASGGLGLS